MKFFWAILSIYIFFLSALPCGDELNCNEFSETHSTLPSNDHQNNSHQDEACSPFCICACCGVQGFISLLPLSFINIPEISSLHFIQPVISISEISFSIWQPPKIV